MFVAAGLCCLLQSCGPAVTDLKFESVNAIDPTNPANAADSRRSVPGQFLLDVHLSTRRDLAAIIKENPAFNIGADTSLCRGRAFDDVRRLQSDPYLFDANVQISAFGDVRNAAPALPDGRFAYEVYVLIAWPATHGDFRYSLRDEPADTCLRLSGGAMLAGTISSNVVVVPASAIAAAFAPR